MKKIKMPGSALWWLGWSIVAIVYLPYGLESNREMFNVGAISASECSWRNVGFLLGVALLAGTAIAALIDANNNTKSV
jgi:hypothetical protein